MLLFILLSLSTAVITASQDCFDYLAEEKNYNQLLRDSKNLPLVGKKSLQTISQELGVNSGVIWNNHFGRVLKINPSQNTLGQMAMKIENQGLYLGIVDHRNFIYEATTNTIYNYALQKPISGSSILLSRGAYLRQLVKSHDLIDATAHELSHFRNDFEPTSQMLQFTQGSIKNRHLKYYKTLGLDESHAYLSGLIKSIEHLPSAEILMQKNNYSQLLLQRVLVGFMNTFTIYRTLRDTYKIILKTNQKANKVILDHEYLVLTFEIKELQLTLQQRLPKHLVRDKKIITGNLTTIVEHYEEGINLFYEIMSQSIILIQKIQTPANSFTLKHYDLAAYQELHNVLEKNINTIEKLHAFYY